jgi:hypothetical protein
LSPSVQTNAPRCGDAGIHRYLPISIKASADCFTDSRGRPRWPPLPPEFTAVLPRVVHGIERHAWRQRRRASGRGGARAALLSRRRSAQQGLFPEIGASASERRSLATALYPILGFIADWARALGYVP